MRAFRNCLWLAAAIAGLGCNAFDDPTPEQGGDARTDFGRPTFDGAAGFDASGSFGDSAGFADTAGTMAPFPFSPPPVPEPLRPIDTRPVLQPGTPPPPIEGGTLLVTRSGQLAVAADPDRDRVSIVDLAQRIVAHEVTLSAGDVPGRLVEDGAGRVHVVLRRAGAVARIDLERGELLGRTEVCGVPRGIDYHPGRDAVLVACAGGELVQLGADDGQVQSREVIEPDLQDVVVDADERVFTTTFKRAELLEVGGAGAVLSRSMPEDLHGPFFGPFSFGMKEQHLQPAVAWSALRAPEGGVVMVHQRAQTDVVEISHGDEENFFAGEGGDGDSDGGGYGGGGGSCDAIVQNGVTFVDAEGGVTSLPPIAGMVLPVDGAISRSGRWMAIAVAGTVQEPLQPTLFGVAPGAIVVDTTTRPSPDTCMTPGFEFPGAMIGSGQTIGVDFDDAGRLVVQTREPNLIRVYSNFEGCGLNSCSSTFDVQLGGEPMRDTGHDLFHVDAGRGISCASCHPGGADDGRTWLFSGLGPRRTQLFNMGIAGTEPLHWDGDMETFDQLVGEVFVRRMGGTPQSEARVAAMADWIETLEPLPPLRASDDFAVLRGRELFESEEVGCASCHSGPLLSNNQSVDVGTGGVFQVPSLVNVAYHRPWIHTGCANTLRERFDPECGGGDAHGVTSQLSEGEIDDLVAYLESL